LGWSVNAPGVDMRGVRRSSSINEIPTAINQTQSWIP
jgi:hypothetical protein